MTRVQHPGPSNGYRATSDTVDGVYVADASRHTGLTMPELKSCEWFEADVWFVRAADEVRERAWRGGSRYRSLREADAAARVEKGRRDKALKRGLRLEWARDRQIAADMAAKALAADQARWRRDAAGALYAAAAAALPVLAQELDERRHGGNGEAGDELAAIVAQLQAAIARADGKA